MVQLELGLSNIRNFRRLAYTPWHAIAELVDNSTQSFFDNRTQLDTQITSGSAPLRVSIALDRKQRRLRVSDNAMGMDLADLERAANVGTPPPDPSGRSSYGLGLKTAGCWLGNRIEIQTTKQGQREVHSITLDVEKIAEGNSDLKHRVIEGAGPDEHYTIVEIWELHDPPVGRTIAKIKDHLRSMYRVDLRNETLQLEWQGQTLEWDDNLGLLKANDGTSYRRDFDFRVSGKRVWGWAGILDRGSRARAGFSMLRANRVVMGWPDSWRPQSIYGQVAGSNDLVNQRLLGEINFDEFDVAHTKDRILLTSKEEEEIDRELGEILSDYKERAKTYRRKDGGTVHLDSQVDAVAAQLRDELESPEMIDQLTLSEVPPPEIISTTLAETSRAIVDEPPHFEALLLTSDGELRIGVFLSSSLSPNDAYMDFDSPEEGRISIVINRRHPYLEFVPAGDGLLNYFRQCTYDALAEWRVGRRAQITSPEAVRLVRDGLMRVQMTILRHSLDSES